MTAPAETYLDNASTTWPKPEPVYQAIDEFARACGASPARGGYARAIAAEELVARCRADLATLLGVHDASRIAFASGSTEALNWALRGLLTRPGDHAVVTALEHNAVLRPLRALERTRGVRWDVVPCDAAGRVDPADVAEALRPETRVVCAIHASNVLGTILPIREIAAVAHERGIPVLVDGSQTAGALPLDLERDEIDLFAFTGHKALLGPPGTGGLYVRAGLDLETSKEGGTGVHSEDLDAALDMPERLEVGTANGWGLAGLAAGVRFVLGVGVGFIRESERKTSHHLAFDLGRIPLVERYGPEDADAKVGLVSVNVGSLPAGEVGRLLAEHYGVSVRSGLHCAPLAHRAIGTLSRGGAVRFSVGPFTTVADVGTAVEAVSRLAATAYRKRRPA